MKIFNIIKVVSVGLFFSGCLSKTITVTSTPPGAILSINDVEIGKTPTTTDWHGGGTYRFELKHKSYQPVDEHIKIKYRWYSYPIIDMGADFMTTKNINDHRQWHFDMQPLQKESIATSKKHAEKMREEFNTLKE